MCLPIDVQKKKNQVNDDRYICMSEKHRENLLFSIYYGKLSAFRSNPKRLGKARIPYDLI